MREAQSAGTRFTYGWCGLVAIGAVALGMLAGLWIAFPGVGNFAARVAARKLGDSAYLRIITWLPGYVLSYSREDDVLAMGFGSSLSLVSLLVLYFWLTYFRPIEIGPRGVRTFLFGRTLKSLDWSDIKAIRRPKAPGAWRIFVAVRFVGDGNVVVMGEGMGKAKFRAACTLATDFAQRRGMSLP